MRRESTEIKFFLENLISGWEQNDETEFFPENSVSFSHISVACAVRTLQFVLFKQALNLNTSGSLINSTDPTLRQ